MVTHLEQDQQSKISTDKVVLTAILSIHVSRNQLRHVVVSSSLTVDMVLRLNNKIKKYYLVGGVRQVSGSF